MSRTHVICITAFAISMCITATWTPHSALAQSYGPSHVRVGQGHVCTTHTDEHAECYGDNTYGQLGADLSGETWRFNVVDWPELDIDDVALGANHTCALHNGGRVTCWGDGRSGQLGHGTRDSYPRPSSVTLDKGAMALALGDNHTCALLIDGALYCWGDNRSGQVGNGGVSDAEPRPVLVPELEGVRHVTAGPDFTCAVNHNSSGDTGTYCWGNLTALGLGSTEPVLTPTLVPGLEDAVQLAAGSAHLCGRSSTGVISCLGQNASGQLGDRTTEARTVAVPVEGLPAASDLRAGGDHTCAVVGQPQTATCWGGNAVGQLGLGDREDRLVPTPLTFEPEVIYVDVGPTATCVMLGNPVWGFRCAGALTGASETFVFGPDYAALWETFAH